MISWQHLVPMCGVLCMAAWSPSSVAGMDLPEGNHGIAARYLGDAGIEGDANVLFVEKFAASTVDDVAQRWDTASETAIMSLSSDAVPGTADKTSLLMSYVGGEGTGGQLYRRLAPGHDQVFARFYGQVGHQLHLGLSLHYQSPTRQREQSVV